jgi:malate dehydrogenase (oxaloacetate-decarboxylating)
LFDVFAGLSKPGILTKEDVMKMKKDPIIFAMANPTPEIMPDEAKKGGAAVVATGRSDFNNQINNSVFFPGFWRGALDAAQSKSVTNFNYSLDLFVHAAEMIAKSVKNLSAENILPSTLDKEIHTKVAKAVKTYFIKLNK